MIDALNQLFDAGERTTADGLVGDQGKEALDLSESRAVGGDKVYVPAGPGGQPGLDLRMAVARLASGQYRAMEYVQCRKQRRRAMALVIVGHAFGVAKAHRQHGLRALERLAQALLIHANGQCVLRRAQIQTDHVTQLLDEERIVGELETPGAMRLEAEQLEIALHTAFGNTGLGGYRVHAPMRGAPGRTSS